MLAVYQHGYAVLATAENINQLQQELYRNGYNKNVFNLKFVYTTDEIQYGETVVISGTDDEINAICESL